MTECNNCSKYFKGFKRVDINELLSNSSYNGDIGLRWKRTKGVMDDILSRYKDPKIVDLAVGGGEDAMFLIKKGYDVVGNDKDDYLSSVAREKARKNGYSLRINNEDWVNILDSENYDDNEFDFAYILGNSFPNYLFDKEDREKALKGFLRILKPKGVLFFDTRNFDYMLDNKEFILEDPENNFRYDGTCTYLKSEDYRCFPTAIEDQSIHWCSKNYSTSRYGCLDLWPATEGRVRDDIETVLGGKVYVETFYDYGKERPDHYDFIQYKITKV
ncbi:MAG: class I SAM-dependent methyltransferase [Candidatus Pacebacteria bacterium]|nr:class I SAM-dependent methyltransferase [Candidatus Paceibacterota bacterium]